MKKQNKIVPGSAILRHKAEKLLKNKSIESGSHLNELEAVRLVHELQVHQIELELQNEEYLLAKEEAEIASQKYAELYDFAPSGFFTLSKDGTIVELNLRGAAMLGKPRSVLINSIFTFFVSDDTKSVFNHFLQKIFSKKTKQSCEVTLSLDDNQPVYIFIKGIISKKEEHCIINVFDISKRKQAEQALLKSEELNRHIILQTTLDGFWLFNNQGKILEVNKTYCRMSGYSKHELLYRQIADFEANETDNEVIARIQKIKEKGSEVFESRHRRKDGSIFDVEVSVNYLALNGGQIVAFIRDISERKRDEELLAFQSKLLSEVNDAVFSSDSNFRITYWNKAAEKMFGWTKEEALGNISGELLKPKTDVSSLDEVRTRLQNEGFWVGEGQYLRKDGTYLFVEVNSKTLKDADGKYNGQIIVARDITERKKAEDAITASEKEFRLLTESMPQIVWTTTADGQNTYFNHQWIEYTGLTLEESYGHGWNKPFHPDDQQRAWDAWQNAVQHKEAYLLQCRLRRFDGVYRWWLIHGVPVVDKNGTITKWYGTCTDIDEMKNAGEAILLNEKLLRSVIDNVSSGVALIDETGKFVVYNPVFLQLFGLSPDSTIKNVNDQDWSQWQVFDENKNLLHVDDHPVRKAAMTGKLVKNQLVAMKLPSGSDYIWMIISAEPLQKEDGSIDKIISTYHDITERKKAQEITEELLAEIRIEKERLATLINNIPDEIWFADLNRNFTLMNPTALQEFGLNKDTIGIAELASGLEVLRPDYSLRPIEEAPPLLALRGLIVKNQEEIIRNPVSGELRNRQVNASPVKDATGKIIGSISIVSDITERKKADAELETYRKHLEDLVTERTADLAVAVSNIERSNKELEEFAYVASHDLQEPLRMVSSYTQLLERRYRDQLDQDAKDFIEYAVDGANRMQQLINDLLEYSRVTSQGKEFLKVDLMQVLGQAVSNLRILIADNLALVTNDDLPVLNVDKTQITRVFQNLIGNAIKYRKQTELPKVHVSCKMKNNCYEFSVSDNGIGIDMQYHDRVFVIFQRLNRKDEYPGTGIGLAVCKRIVERHGGTIWFESKKNEGTTFYFTLQIKT